MERTMNDIVKESNEQGRDSQWKPETEEVTVCECCGSENVHTAGDGGMGFCEDCDAPCSTVTKIVVEDDEEERDDPRADLYALQ